ncbi:YcgN family cysteine cluster protein [Paraburkholderia aspalathi]|nr:YcgN family cysteine cluster protein [Paraburkholderia aspalathi]
MEKKPFWQTKTLEEMNAKEWESLCDGCGQCCMHKLQDDDTNEIYWTSVACTLLDAGSCQCSDYPERRKTVPDCVFLTPEIIHTVPWLPKTCAYRLVAEGQDLYWWHPLVSGSVETVHEAGISVRGKITAFDHELESDDAYIEHMTGVN